MRPCGLRDHSWLPAAHGIAHIGYGHNRAPGQPALLASFMAACDKLAEDAARHIHSPLLAEDAARHIQSASRSYRVRRAANILARLPLDLKRHTIEICQAPPPGLELDISWERMTAVKMAVLGIQADEIPGASSRARWQLPHTGNNLERHFMLLEEAYVFATLHHAQLSVESTQVYLVASHHYSVRCLHESSRAWMECKEAMRKFAEQVVLAQAARRGATQAVAMSAAWYGSHAIEAAIMCTGA